MQAALVGKYFGFMVTQNPKQQADAAVYEPATAVILCLRGDDPSLNDCLNSLLAQDYPSFEIHFVLDSQQDPALDRLQGFLADNADSTIKTKTIFLTDDQGDSSKILQSCSLKNQALIAAVSDADDSIEVFALVDADGVVDENWLTELTKPLSDPMVGVSSGSRWFAPRRRNPGSIVRQTWNAAALPQMNFYNIPWGGALAIRRSAIDSCDLLSHWSHGFCEDTMLPEILAKSDFKIAHVPSVIVESDESTSLASAMNWISRQLLTVRLHHRSWPLVLGHAVFSGLCLVAGITTVICCMWQQHYFQGVRLALVIAAFLIGNVALLQMIQVANRRGSIVLNRKPGHATSAGASTVSRGPRFLGSLLTQLLYPLIAIKAALMREVQWRGITYSIGPGKKISMEQYRPYHTPDEKKLDDTSL